MKVSGTIFLIVGVVLFIIFGLHWIPVIMGRFLTPNPPEPRIKYGEFPFKLEYEIDGERYVIEDTLICEYDGIKWNEGTGKSRKWKSYLASGGNIVLLKEVSLVKKIFYYPGPASYYMGDRLNPYEHSFPDASYIEREGSITSWDILNEIQIIEQYGLLNRNRINEKELLDKYNIKLINWEYTEPIVNSFDKK